MDAWSDVEGAIQAAIKQRNDHLERLIAISAISILLGAIWLVWPTLSSAIKGEGGLLNGLGLPIIILIWGLLVQDIGLSTPSSRTRVGASATIAWPILLMIASNNITEGLNSELFGSILIIIVSGSCFLHSKDVLNGGLDVQRFRALMTGVGAIAAFSLFVGSMPEPGSINWIANVSVISIAGFITIYIWISGDENKVLRKKFRKRLDELEIRILVLRSEKAAVDQASSLIMTAREEGHVDPELGMRLLDDAEEDIERSLSLAGDVQVVMEDAKNSVEKAENIAPTAKKSRKSYEMGIREIELGSLREGEMLFRQAKKRSLEIIEWWARAENAIAEASRQLDGKNGEDINHLHEMLSDARKKLAAESPKKAFEYAFTIPTQLAAGDDAMGRAAESIKEAERQLSQSDGLDTSELEMRLNNAIEALESGNASQAVGLADGVMRNIKTEREAMDDIRRALRQKKKLIKKYESREDSEMWQKRLDEIIQAADSKQWSHAATLLERMTSELDKEGKAADDARELLEFVIDEWKVLRNQCEAVMVKASDEDRVKCEAAISKASETLEKGSVDSCLEQLSIADDMMERLRRRI
tara:strand:+ start:3219 stop:4979 length:1761 start_codon:yes stop_codon:yes gene_type:complete